jgi:hypothetical protein
VGITFIWTHESAQTRRIEPGPKVVQAALRIPFFAGELVRKVYEEMRNALPEEVRRSLDSFKNEFL